MNWIQKWQAFLDSLTTKGGNTFILIIVFAILLVAGILLMIKFGPTAPAVVLVVGSFNGFQGALLMGLVGKDRNGNGSGTPPAAPAV